MFRFILFLATYPDDSWLFLCLFSFPRTALCHTLHHQLLTDCQRFEMTELAAAATNSSSWWSVIYTERRNSLECLATTTMYIKSVQVLKILLYYWLFSSTAAVKLRPHGAIEMWLLLLILYPRWIYFWEIWGDNTGRKTNKIGTLLNPRSLTQTNNCGIGQRRSAATAPRFFGTGNMSL